MKINDMIYDTKQQMNHYMWVIAFTFRSTENRYANYSMDHRSSSMVGVL